MTGMGINGAPLSAQPEIAEMQRHMLELTKQNVELSKQNVELSKQVDAAAAAGAASALIASALSPPIRRGARWMLAVTRR